MRQVKFLIDFLFFRIGWVMAFFAMTYLTYGFAKKNKIEEKDVLEGKIVALEEKKQYLLSEQEDLLLQINSQNDSSWIELVLMRELGVVPEKQIKVHFTKEK